MHKGVKLIFLGRGRAWSGPLKGLALLFLLTLACAVPLAQPTAPPTGDYGEAPDGLSAGYSGSFAGVVGRFPTLYASTSGAIGAHALEVPLEEAAILGDEISWETDANDPNDPDGTANLIWDDFNDGVEIEAPATLVFKVKIGPKAPDITRYINVLIDLDRSGAWDKEDEWVIKNLAISVLPGTSQDIAQPLPQPAPEAVVAHPSLAWMRVALTPSPIAEAVAWDGSGEFAAGEIEDYPVVGVDQGAIAIATAEAVAKVAARAHAFAKAAAEAQALVAAAVEAIAKAEAEAQAYAAVKIPPLCVKAWDWARAIIPPLKAEAEAYVEKTAYECKRATATASDFDRAIAPCRAYKDAWAAVCGTISQFQQKVKALTAQVPCATVVAQFTAAAEAISKVCAGAYAEAEATALAWSEAYAHAGALAEACAEAEAVAEAHALAIAEAYADAEGFAKACAEAQAVAEAYAKAVAEAKAKALAAAEAAARAVSIAESSARAAAIAAAQATAAVQAKGLSLAFGAQIKQTLVVLGAPVVNALAAALTAVEAAAAAAAQAQAAALAAVEARARAEAEVEVLAAVYARAWAYAEAAAEALARAKAEVEVLAAAYARAAAYAKAIADALATANAICGAKAEASASAQAMTALMLSLEGSISAIPSGNCPREICRLDPPPVTVQITTTVIKKECEEECWTACGGYEYETCWLECVAVECKDVEKEISGLEILVNGRKYKPPVTIQEEMKSELRLEAPGSYTETIISIWPPSISITVYGFSYWECDGVRTRNRSYAFTLNGNVTCKAVYGAQ